MVKRKRIALLFTYDENWIGGTYYVLNIVQALNLLPDHQKPDLTICTQSLKEFEYLKNETNYPYLSVFELIRRRRSLPFFKRIVNNFLLKMNKREYFYYGFDEKLLPNLFDFVFPNPSASFFEKIDMEKKVFWFADFQENYYPEFFTEKEVIKRKQWQMLLAIRARKIVLSSNDGKNDFEKLYPFSKCKIYVIPFAVTHPVFHNIKIEDIRAKYNISNEQYFYAPNQFWIHKNHKILLDAVLKLKVKNNNILLLFSGKEDDYGSNQYVSELKSFVTKHSLEDNILFLGFIDRKEQLVLMKNAVAIIQPSLFEGWSTVVEDAKSLNKFVIASNINVHKEQLVENCLFFDPQNVDDLVASIETVLQNNIVIKHFDYKQNIKKFALDFIKI